MLPDQTLRAASGCALVLLVACLEERLPCTAIDVSVKSDLALSAIVYRVYPNGVEGADPSSTHVAEGAALGRPLAIEHGRFDALRVVIQGDAAAGRVTYEARARFEPAQTRALQVFLSSACLAKRCAAGETCYGRIEDGGPPGTCGPVPMRSVLARVNRPGDESNWQVPPGDRAAAPSAPAPPAASAPGASQLDAAFWERWHRDHCDQVVDVRAHGTDARAPLVVPAYEEVKATVSFDSTWGDEPVQVLAFTPLVDNAQVLADFSLHASADAPGEGPPRRVYEWFPGLPGTDAWTDDAGIALAQGPGVLSLDLHYYNLDGPAQTDRSGVRLCLVRGARRAPIRLGVADLGVREVRIPAGSEHHVVTRTCTFRSPQAAALVSATPGMHKLGTGWRLRVDKARAGKGMDLEAPYRFGERVGFRLHPDFLVEDGDRITSSCTYTNRADEGVEGGWRSAEEVCRLSVNYYPEGALVCD